jgi:hypothetical protein
VPLYLRFAGIGLDFRESRELSRRVYRRKLLYRDRPDEEFYFIAEVIGILQTQPKIFVLPTQAFPGARDDIWFNQRVPRFIAMAERLRQGLSSAFQEQAHRIQIRAALERLGKGRPGSVRVGRAGSRT